MIPSATLKTWPKEFKAIVEGRKTFDYRKEDDKEFRVDGFLLLREWNPEMEKYTGREYTVKILYILRGPEFGIPEGYAVMSIKNDE